MGCSKFCKKVCQVVKCCNMFSCCWTFLGSVLLFLIVYYALGLNKIASLWSIFDVKTWGFNFFGEDEPTPANATMMDIETTMSPIGRSLGQFKSQLAMINKNISMPFNSTNDLF